MSAVADEPKTKANAKSSQKSTEDRKVIYVPLGGHEEIELTIGMVRSFLTTPTKSGCQPTDAEVVKFMMLCKARALNPWEGDAYLTGYDSKDGPVFSLITAVQALLKRAEVCEEFDGIESGVIVLKGDDMVEREGSLVLPGENLIGGWSRCYRSDRSKSFYQSVNFSVYNTGYSRWAKDPSGMIQKVAKAHVLREAFPNHLAGLKTDDEMVVDGEVVKAAVAGNAKAAAATAISEVLKRRNQEAGIEPRIESKPEPLKFEMSLVAQEVLADIQMAKSKETLQFALREIDGANLIDGERERLLEIAEEKSRTLEG